jgi:uncharacterized protein YbcV (DUF1398 family)
MNTAILNDCLLKAFAGTISFPESVGMMLETGVERYDVDLARLEKTHYGVNGETHTKVLPLTEAPAVSAAFSPEGVQAAIKASQSQEIAYPEFLRRIMAAGTACYHVYLNGRKVLYFGRNGDFHIEPFPNRP